MKPVLVFALTSVAGLSLAAPVSAAPPTATPMQNSMRSFPGVSNSGNAIINEGNRPDPQLDALGRQARAVRDQMAAAANGSAVDVDRVAGLLRQSDSLQAQGRQRVTERIIATMRQLSAADRAAFVRDLVTPSQGGAQQR